MVIFYGTFVVFFEVGLLIEEGACVGFLYIIKHCYF